MNRLVPVFAIALLFSLFVPGLSGANNSVPRSYKIFSHFDINGDGVISEKEGMALSSIRFLAMDSDDNGVITLKEASSFKRLRAYKHREFGKFKGKRVNDPAFDEKRALGKDGIKARLKERGEVRFIEADKDKDGKLTKKEFDDIRKRRFNTMDTTVDGRVSLDEFIAYEKTQKSAMGRAEKILE
jgi:hypothetical protein